MNWDAIGSIVGATVAVLTLLLGVNAVVVRWIVRDEVAKINGTYLRSMGSTLTGTEIERWRDATERRLAALEE
jgi:hypothetical protein